MISAEAFLQKHSVVIDDPIGEVSDADSGRVKRVKREKRGSSSAGAELNPQDVDACREAALRLLDAAPRSCAALQTRLIDKGYDEQAANTVVERLAELKLLDDQAYAESTVRYCLNRLMGERGTVMELRRKGIDYALASRVVDEAAQQGLFEESAWELGRKVFRKTQGLDRQVRLRRFWAAGGRKGHNPEALRRVAHELMDE